MQITNIQSKFTPSDLAIAAYICFRALNSANTRKYQSHEKVLFCKRNRINANICHFGDEYPCEPVLALIFPKKRFGHLNQGRTQGGEATEV